MKSRILIIQPKLNYYRVPIFNILCDKYSVTVLHSGQKLEDDNIKFDQIYVSTTKVGPFFILRKNLHLFCKKFDVIISEGNIRHLDRWFLILNPLRKFKWINWSIGVSASYNKRFDEDRKYEFIRHFLFKKSDASIFYSDYPVKIYSEAGLDRNSLFVANNTTFVHYNENIEFNKNSLLFVGTLYKQKKIYQLLQSYADTLSVIKDPLPLFIVGSGDEYENIEKWISEKNLQNYVTLLGAIFNPKELEPLFRSALVCISPGQAGLSVLTSMGYGTPFVTTQGAITGGEIFSIANGINGILYKRDDDLTKIIIDINLNQEKYIQMGLKAREFYLKERSVSQMVAAITDAIDYSLQLK